MGDTNASKKKWLVKRIIVISIIAILSIAAVLLYNNFNRLLSNALINGFNSNVISDVYELKFEKLRVDFLEASIGVFNVTLQPREKPLRSYPYINSSLRLTAERIALKNVSLLEMFRTGKLNLERISIIKPDIELLLSGKRHRLIPLKDSVGTDSPTELTPKKTLESFDLHEFQLVDASIHTRNEEQQREFRIERFTISLYDLFIRQTTGMDAVSIKQAALSISKFTGSLRQGALRDVSFADYRVKVDSLNIQQTLDTLRYSFYDFNGGLKALNIQTADSIFHVTMQSFDLSYHDKSIKLGELSFKPNVSELELQKKYRFQHADFSGTVASLNILQINFDSLMYSRKVLIDEIVLDDVAASIFKDKTKPLDKKRFPFYLGQMVRNIPIPLLIKHVNATNVKLINTERKPDSTLATVTINKATLEVENITNRDLHSNLVMTADAFIEGRAHFRTRLIFHYQIPQFDFETAVEKFDLSDLNPLIQAYTPAKINQGKLDEIAFSGVAGKTKATGTLKFLYHDLVIDLELREQAKWKSAVVSFAANTVLNSSNPSATDLPPRVVKFHVDRDMNKGFVNVLIKSLLNGLQETMIMSKENKKAYKQAKDKAKEKRR